MRVCDHHDGRAQFAAFAVECGDAFALGGGAYDQLGTCEFVGVEGVHGLAVFEHHVVADIDHVVNRTQADGGEALLHPLGAGADVDPGDHRGGVERAAGGAVDADGF